MSDSENEDGVFENINVLMKKKFVTRKKYLRKVEVMKRELVQKDEELHKIKAEYEREKLKNDIIIAEKNVVTCKFNELKLKLKLKTQEYDELSNSNKPDDNMTEQVSIGIQTIEKEPTTTDVETVKSAAATPSSAATISSASATSSTPSTSSAAMVSEEVSIEKKRVKRKQQDLVLPRRSKRNANLKISDTTMDTKASTVESTEPTVATVPEAPMKLSKTIYNCYECIHKWAKKVKENYSYRFTSGDYTRYRTIADKSKAPDPKLKIKRFTNIEDYVNHLDTIHGWTDRDIIRGKCGIAFLVPWREPEREYNYTPDGDKICKICDARFDVEARYNQHFELEHADLDKITKTELYDIWVKYDDQPYARFEPENLERFKKDMEEHDRYLREKYKDD